MIQSIQLKLFIAIVVLALPMAVAQAETINIMTVPVGNLGNDNDIHGDGYGSVDYAYNIGTYEVTAGQYVAFLNAVAKTDIYGLYNTDMNTESQGCQITRNGTSGSYIYDFSGGAVGASGSTATDWANRPVNYISWGDAARFANWLHNGQPNGEQNDNTTEDGAYYLNGATSQTALLAVNREAGWRWAIPSENEWYKAAFYDPNKSGAAGYYDYSTSSDSKPSNALAEPSDPGNNATFNDSDNSGYTIDSPYWRTKVGAHENSESPCGTFDQSGNVWEWNESVIYDSHRGLRGGSFGSVGSFLSASIRNLNDPIDEGSQNGFRVVSVPEPGCSILLVCGLLASLIWWRRETRLTK